MLSADYDHIKRQPLDEQSLTMVNQLSSLLKMTSLMNKICGRQNEIWMVFMHFFERKVHKRVTNTSVKNNVILFGPQKTV